MTVVSKFPGCDLCGAEAHFDTITVYGSWAFTCDTCQNQIGLPALGLTLGLGRGQRLTLAE